MTPTKEMKAYAVEQMTLLLQNMATRPIECYSVKERGQDKKFFLGRNFIDKLIADVKKYNK